MRLHKEIRSIGFCLVVLMCLVASNAAAQNAAWVAAWGASQQSQGEMKVTNATVRMIARVTLSGDALRIRLDNTFGKAPVTFSKVTIAPRTRGPAVAVGLIKPLTFQKMAGVTIPVGESVVSDALPVHVDAQEDLAVSLFVSGDAQPSQHNNAVVTSYLTENGAGDATNSADGKEFTGRTTSMFWLKAIDVQATGATAIVAFGDSITDGTCTTLDAHDRWEDVLAQRLALQGSTRSVVNEGIGGNTVTNAPNYQPPANSDPGLIRLDRDVLSHSGISHVVLFMGTNDIRRGAPADLVINGLKTLIERIRAHGNIKVVGATIIPRHTTVPGVADTGWNDEKTKIRRQVNEWIRKQAGFDAVLDFDRIIASKSNPDLMEQSYNCGDGVHPSPLGYFQMGKSVNLATFGVK
jgi:lysophospholipase L1-like esterase